jgi:hypothetical protein
MDLQDLVQSCSEQRDPLRCPGVNLAVPQGHDGIDTQGTARRKGAGHEGDIIYSAPLLKFRRDTGGNYSSLMHRFSKPGHFLRLRVFEAGRLFFERVLRNRIAARKNASRKACGASGREES